MGGPNTQATKRCCAMQLYTEEMFRSCQTHARMECNGFEISGKVTICSKVDTDHLFKGICVPSKFNCKAKTDCPTLVLNDEQTGKNVFTSTDCSNENLCEYDFS